jgi:hypothetical protein
MLHFTVILNCRALPVIGAGTPSRRNLDYNMTPNIKPWETEDCWDTGTDHSCDECWTDDTEVWPHRRLAQTGRWKERDTQGYQDPGAFS